MNVPPENHHGDMPFKSLLPDRSGRKVTLVGSWRAAGRHNAVLGRAHGMADLLWRVPQWQTGEKNIYIFEVFSGLEVPEHRSRCSPRSPTSLSVIYK